MLCCIILYCLQVCARIAALGRPLVVTPDEAAQRSHRRSQPAPATPTRAPDIGLSRAVGRHVVTEGPAPSTDSAQEALLAEPEEPAPE